MRTLLEELGALGPLALAPWALNATATPVAVTPVRGAAGVAVVSVRGPLLSRCNDTFDSYDSVLERVRIALAAKPKALVLELDTPGGSAQGCLEAARELRASCAAAGVRLYAFVASAACSAGYALACAAEQIYVRPTSIVGSVGTYHVLIDQTALDAAMGLTYRVVATGERKTDGNPHVPLSDGAVAAAQAVADHLGDLFFALVEEMRGVPGGQVRALAGGVAIGRDAIEKGLADAEVVSLQALLGVISGAEGKTVDEIKKNLQAIIDDPNASEEDKAAAKRMLAALEPAPAAEDDKKPEAQGSPATATSEDAKDDAEAKATRALAEVHRLRAEMAERDALAEREQLLASRPDFAPELRASLAKSSTPIEVVRDMVKTLPRIERRFAASANVLPTRGETQQSGDVPRMAPEAKAQLDARMGLTRPAFGVVDNGDEQLFGAPVAPKKA